MQDDSHTAEMDNKKIKRRRKRMVSARKGLEEMVEWEVFANFAYRQRKSAKTWKRKKPTL